MPPADALPPPPAESIWARGSRTVSQAAGETGLSRDELFALMREGVVRWFHHGGRRTRIIAWGDLVDHLERLHAEHLKGQGREQNRGREAD